jgi:beta-N-acetylhexosaminidase
MRAPILALQAGADVLLQPMPNDVGPVIDAIVKAVRDGELTEARIDESVRRVLAAKEQLQLNRGARVPLERIPAVLGSPAHMAMADTVAQRSITLVRDRDGLVPMKATRVLSVVYTDEHDPWALRTFQRDLAAAVPGTRTALLTAESGAAELEALRAATDSAELIVVSPFIRVRAYRGSLALSEPVAAWVRELAARKPLVMISFGNPYVLQQLPELSTYLVAWGGAESSQRAAVRALTGRAAITGKLPIPIPPLHAVGDGVLRPVQATQ